KREQACNAFGGQHVVVAKKLDELTPRVRDASREISSQPQVFSLPQVPYAGIAGRSALRNRRRGVHGMIIGDQYLDVLIGLRTSGLDRIRQCRRVVKSRNADAD